VRLSVKPVFHAPPVSVGWLPAQVFVPTLSAQRPKRLKGASGRIVRDDAGVAVGGQGRTRTTGALRIRTETPMERDAGVTLRTAGARCQAGAELRARHVRDARGRPLAGRVRAVGVTIAVVVGSVETIFGTAGDAATAACRCRPARRAGRYKWLQRNTSRLRRGTISTSSRTPCRCPRPRLRCLQRPGRRCVARRACSEVAPLSVKCRCSQQAAPPGRTPRNARAPACDRRPEQRFPFSGDQRVDDQAQWG
jgi:hypothetical protein